MRILTVVVAMALSLSSVYAQHADGEQQRLAVRQYTKTNARHPYVCTDENVELMEVVARLADNSIFNNSYAPRYQRDCDEYFAAFKTHPAVDWMRGQLPRYGISYDAVPWMGLHLKWNGQVFSVIPNCNKNYKRWPKEAVNEFVPLLDDFYVKSNFHKFYVAHEPMYKAAVDSVRTNIAAYIDLDWFDRFFKVKDKVDFRIVVGMNNGTGSFGIERQIPGGNREKIAVLLYSEGPDGAPYYRKDNEEDKILVHEFCHPYIKAKGKYERYKNIGEALLNRYRRKLNSVGYGSWQNVIEESFVRASVIRYMLDHGYSGEAILKEIKTEHEYYGFVWLPENIEWYRGDVFSLFDNPKSLMLNLNCSCK